MFYITMTVAMRLPDQEAASIIKDLLTSLSFQQDSYQPKFICFKAINRRQVQGKITGAQEAVGFALSASRSKQWGIELTLFASNAAQESIEPSMELSRKSGVSKKAPGEIAVTLLDQDGVEVEALQKPTLGIIEATLQLLCSLETRRSEEGQEAGLLINSGASQSEAAHLLGVSQQAVSARLSAGHWYESRKAAYWVAKQLDELSRV